MSCHRRESSLQQGLGWGCGLTGGVFLALGGLVVLCVVCCGGLVALPGIMRNAAGADEKSTPPAAVPAPAPVPMK